MTARAHIPGKKLLAAALLMHRDENGEPWIPHEHAKIMHHEHVISLFNPDHYPIPHAEGGPDEHWNITWMPIMGHREKTAKVDVPRIAKGKRIARKEVERRRRMLAKDTGEPVREQRSKYRWGKGQKIRSRGFQRRRT